MCLARVPAPVPRIILCRGRLATISSISGMTAARPRSMMLWPPILTTLTHGRIAKSGVSSVARCNVGSVSDSPTSRLPSAVSMELSALCIAGLFLGKPEKLDLEPVDLGKDGVERAEFRLRPQRELAQRRLARGARQSR